MRSQSQGGLETLFWNILVSSRSGENFILGLVSNLKPKVSVSGLNVSLEKLISIMEIH